MKYFIYLSILLFSFHSVASPKKKIKSLLSNYLYAINLGDEDELIDLVSERYIKLLKRNNLIDQTKERANKLKTKLKKDKNFDIKLKRSPIDKNFYFVNVKNKHEIEYDDYWYVVKRIDGKFIIDDMKMLED